MIELQSSPACERNKDPILSHLRSLFSSNASVLEIGSGTGQHAVHFAMHMPWLRWTCSDRTAYHATLRTRIRQSALDNIDGPIELDVTAGWPADRFDAVFSANTAHIMPWPAVEAMFEGVGRILGPAECFVLYGPVHYSNTPTSAGNAAFDRELQSRGGGEGIRDIDALIQLASCQHLRLIADLAMPACNRMLAWEKARDH